MAICEQPGRVVDAHGVRTAGISDNTRDELPATRSALRVLIVEDNQVNQMIAQLMLQQLGYEPQVVSNGEEAVAAATRAHYDLVLMDLNMPRMGGLEAARRIRAFEVASLARPAWIVALSASDREEVGAEHDACLDGFLSKPVMMDDLERITDLVAYAVGCERAS